jgi:hypothetical protein
MISVLKTTGKFERLMTLVDDDCMSAMPSAGSIPAWLHVVRDITKVEYRISPYVRINHNYGPMASRDSRQTGRKHARRSSFDISSDST